MKNIRARLQAFGGFLTSMVIPNMGAFIAWGFITALFIPTGWIPNANFNELVSPMVTYMLPLLLAYTGGSVIYGKRGGVAGVVATMGLIVGSDIPQFLGAMIMGPFPAWCMKKFDEAIQNKIPAGFEMVLNNFSLGILGFIFALVSYSFVGPVIEVLIGWVTTGIEWLVKVGFLPLLAVINEPAKVLFLNNVIDQAIYYPLGMQQALETGKSIFFMVASNPGTGLGLLLAYTFFGPGATRKTAPGCIIIQFLGGIHEVYFPYVLMNPIMIVPMILGSAAGITCFWLTGAGLAAGPSPGSIFAYLMLTPKGSFFGMLLGVTVSALVCFLIASLILKNKKNLDDGSGLQEAQEKSKAMKQEGKDLLNTTMQDASAPKEAPAKPTAKIQDIAFACDAGLGSSALGANAFRKQLSKYGIEMHVQNYAIENVPEASDVIVTHESLEDRARLKYPNKKIVTIKNFMRDPHLEELLSEILTQEGKNNEN